MSRACRGSNAMHICEGEGWCYSAIVSGPEAGEHHDGREGCDGPLRVSRRGMVTPAIHICEFRR